MAQNEMNAIVFQVLRAGGSGRMSSLIHTETSFPALSEEEDSVTSSMALFRIGMVERAILPNRGLMKQCKMV